MLLAFAQNIGGFWNVDERSQAGNRFECANADEEMRVCRISAASIDPRVGRPECVCWMKRERFHAILQQQLYMGKAAGQFSLEFLRLKLVLVKRIWPGLSARLLVVGFVGRRDNQ